MTNAEDLIMRAVGDFKQWISQNSSSSEAEVYQKLLYLYRWSLLEIADVPCTWTKFYRDCVIPQYVNNTSNSLYEAISFLIELQKEKDWGALTQYEKITFLTKINEKYELTGIHLGWLRLHEAENPNLGEDGKRLCQALEYFYEALSLKTQNNFVLARDFFNKSLLLDPTNAEAERQFGFTLKDYAFSPKMVDKKMHLLKQAERHLQKAIKLNPYGAMCEQAYGLLLKDWAVHFDDMTKFEEARKHFEKAIDLEPNNTDVQQAFFYFYVDYEKAVKKQKGIAEIGQRNIDDKETATRKAESVFAYYDLGKVLDVGEVLWGYVNRIYFVETTKGTFVLKQCVEHSTPEEIIFEYNLIKYIKNKGLPVADILPHTKEDNKGIFVTFEDKHYIVCEFIEGSQIMWKEISGLKLESMARTLARYNNIVSEYKPPTTIQYRRRCMAVNIDNFSRFEALKSTLEKREQASLSKVAKLFLSNFDYVQKQVNKVRDAITESVANKLLKIIIHGDFHSLNIRFKGDEVNGTFDWDYIREDFRLIDIVICLVKIQAFAKGGSDINTEQVRRFMVAYQMESQLSEDEKRVLPDMFRAYFMEEIMYRFFSFQGIENAEKNSDGDNKLCLSFLYNMSCLRLIDKHDWNETLKIGN